MSWCPDTCCTSYSSIIERTLQHLPHPVWFKNSHIWLSTVSQFVHSLKGDPSAICWKVRLEEQQVKMWCSTTGGKKHLMVEVGGAMDHPTQPIPQTADLTSVQSALMCLCKITDAGDGRQANTFMWAIINNLWISIGSTPNPILSAHYPTKLVGQHLLCWIKEFLAHNPDPLMKSYIETANDAVIKQVVLFLDPNWFEWMTPFMCTKKMWAFEQAYEAEAGELGPKSLYSAVLMPVLKVTSNGSIVSDWEACPNGRMADEWESDDEGEEEGVSAADLQWLVAFVQQIRPLMWQILAALGAGTDLHVASMIIYHARSLDPNEGTRQGRNQNIQGWGASLFQKIKKQAYFNLQNGKLAQQNVARSEESIVLSKEVADDDGGVLQEHFEENLSFLTCPLLNMSALPNFTNFAFHCGQGVPSDWTEAHTQSLYNSIPADPIQRNKNIWMPTHICWMMKSIWFCDKTAQIAKVTGSGPPSSGRSTLSFSGSAMPAFERTPSAVPASAGTYQISWVNVNWLATSNPISSDADTGPSDGEPNEDEDMGYGAVQPPAIPMDEDPTPSEGEGSRNEVGEEWQVVSETLVNLVAVQVAATLAGLVAYGASSDDGSGEEEEEKVEGEDNKTSDADDKREKEQEEQLKGGELSDSTPKSKGEVIPTQDGQSISTSG
ncbi:hypothetical protein ARMGADRAFT_1037209 [Armillaria gallica]|uniref:Uncharacterized protein n=1 Tax=Armillaria gallica TaxID=47427 RepID=A0A2H3CS75_ARMGA|nr:hypothetical protein ARMGADRAFT_1037209 [Armillaria gallica]